MIIRTLALAALAFVSVSASAAQYAPGSQITVQGKVSGFQSARTFWMEVDGDTILVYGTNAQRASLITGQTIRVEGSISDDFIKLADVELQARRIETIAGTLPMSTAAMQN